MEIKLTRIAITLLLTLLVLIIIVGLGLNTFLFFKGVELKGIIEKQREESVKLESNRGKYIDLKTTIEEQRKEIIQLQQRNNRCFEKLEETLADLRKYEKDGRLSEKNLGEKDLLD